MKRYFPAVLLLCCGAAFAFGIVQLFKLRFDAGDVYPEYSSLRSDPLGTMALYESLAKNIQGISAQRDYSTTGQLPDGPNVTYLHIAAPADEWRRIPDGIFREIQRFLARGGRLVITFRPQPSTGLRLSERRDDGTNSKPAKETRRTDGESKEAKKVEPANSKKKKTKNEREEAESGFNFISLQDRWGVDFITANLVQGDDDTYEPARVLNRTELPLPHALDWHSGIVFTNLDTRWRTIYTRGRNPVVIERKIGHGSVVMATDSYHLSNEAMQKDRHADLLIWLIGSGKTVVFDEAHLGVTESSGVATLMLRYRLHGLIAGLVLLAGLFIWKNVLSLVPRPTEQQQPDCVAGKDSAAGFVNLLRRSVAPRDLLETCYSEWKRTAALTGKYSGAKLQHAEAAFQAELSIPREDRHPIRTYQTLCGILTGRNSKLETRNPELEP